MTTANHRSKVVKVLRRIVEHHQSHILRLVQEVMILTYAHATHTNSKLVKCAYNKCLKTITVVIPFTRTRFNPCFAKTKMQTHKNNKESSKTCVCSIATKLASLHHSYCQTSQCSSLSLPRAITWHVADPYNDPSPSKG